MPLILTPFRFVNFRLWCGANVVSVTATWMQVLAANWLLLTVTGSATQMGVGVLLYALPALLLGAWAGTLADRLPARPLLTATQVLRATVSLTLAAVAAGAVGGPVTLWIYAATLAAGVVGAVESPALGRLGSTTVDREHLGAALAVGSVSGSAGRIIGMSLGGVLVAASGAGPVFLANAATFLVVVLILHRLRTTPADPATAPQETGDGVDGESVPTSTLAGLRYLLRDPMVTITLALALLLGSLCRNYQVTMAAMTAGPLRCGSDGYGTLSTIFAVGALAGGLFAARAGRMYGRHLVVVGGGMSILQAASGLAPGLWSFAAMLVPIAAAAVVFDTVVATRLQLDKPLAVRGRVLGALGTTGAIAGVVGAPVLGWLSDGVGPRAALLVAGALTTLGCVAAGVGYRAIRHRRGTPTGSAEPVTTDPTPVARPHQTVRRAFVAAPAAAPRPVGTLRVPRPLCTLRLPRPVAASPRPARPLGAPRPRNPLAAVRPATTAFRTRHGRRRAAPAFTPRPLGTLRLPEPALAVPAARGGA